MIKVNYLMIIGALIGTNLASVIFLLIEGVYYLAGYLFLVSLFAYVFTRERIRVEVRRGFRKKGRVRKWEE